MEYKEGWHWITHPHEGDVWQPVYVRKDDFMLDGKTFDLDVLNSLIVVEAIMPMGDL